MKDFESDPIAGLRLVMKWETSVWLSEIAKEYIDMYIDMYVYDRTEATPL